MPRATARRRATRKDRTTLADQLRKAIEDSGLNDHALATRAGIDPGTVGRFQRKERDWTLATADQVAEVLGLRLASAGRGSVRKPASQATGTEAA